MSPPSGTAYHLICDRLAGLPVFLEFQAGTSSRAELQRAVGALRPAEWGLNGDQLNLATRFPEDEAATVISIVAKLAADGALPSTSYPEEGFEEHRARVDRAFDHGPNLTYIFPEEARLLFAIAHLVRPRRTLFLGSYYGYWAVWALSGIAAADGEAVLIDPDPSVLELSRHNMRQFGYTDSCTFVCDDAIAYLEAHKVSCDLVVLDAEGPELDGPPNRRGKAIYGPLTVTVTPHLRPGGLLVAHNVACRVNQWGAVMMGVPNAAFRRHGGHLAGCVELPSLGLPVETLHRLVTPHVPAAIVPAGELAVPVADRLAARLGLPHNPLDRLTTYRDKDAMRVSLAAAGVCQPVVYGTFSSTREADRFNWSSVRFPVIVKPVDGSASYFVVRCENAESIPGALQPIFRHARSNATGLPFRRQALVEEFVGGPEFSAQCIVAGGEVRAVLPVMKFVSPLPHRDETAHLCGNVLGGQALHRVREAVAKIICAFGVDATVMHVDFKFTPDGEVCVIEVGNRVCGDRISELVELCHGWVLEEAFIRLRAGLPCSAAYRSERVGSRAAYGIKFLFSFNHPIPVPASVCVLEREATDRYPTGSDHGPYHISRRVGYVLAGGDDVDALRWYLAA